MDIDQFPAEQRQAQFAKARGSCRRLPQVIAVGNRPGHKDFTLGIWPTNKWVVIQGGAPGQNR